MTSIFFVRHGQVENPDGLIYGRMPGYHLSTSGKEESERVGKFLIDKNITWIFTSPLERAVETAEIIAKYFPDAKIERKYDLIEVDATKWQSLKIGELAKNTSYEKFLNDPYNTETGENLRAVAGRMKKITQEILQTHQSTRIVCVSHEIPILALKTSLENKPLETLKNQSLPPGGVLGLGFDDRGNLVESQMLTFPEP